MPKARVKLPEALELLLRSELECAIREANLGKDGTEIARRYLIDKVSQMDIAIEFGYERSTISRRIQKITSKVEYTGRKMKLIT